MVYRDEALDEDGRRRRDAYWRWYREAKRRGDLVAGVPCFAAGAEHEAEFLEGRENERIRELEKQNAEMLVLATKCAGALKVALPPIRNDMLEDLLVRVHAWITRNKRD